MVLEDAHALVIGVSSAYQHLPCPPLSHNAQDLAATLVDPQTCGYPPENVRLLIEEQATRQAILDELRALAARTGPSSTVLIYFNGHGSRGRPSKDEDYRYYLMPVDARNQTLEEMETTAISRRELHDQLTRLPAGRLTVVLDCCRAAALAQPTDPSAGELVALPLEEVNPLARGRGRVVLSSSRGEESSYAPKPGERYSAFTGALLRGLRGEAEGANGILRICDLYDFVQRRVVATSPLQHPVFRAELEENYPIALIFGGVQKLVELPPPPDDKPYDVFVTYCDGDDADRAWARKVMIPYLERRGLRVCFERRDFRLGFSRLKETERAVGQSRYTVAVFSPAYLASDFDDYQALLAAHDSIESGAPRFIPLLRRECPLALHVRMTALLDVSRDPQVPAALERLTVSLRRLPVRRHT